MRGAAGLLAVLLVAGCGDERPPPPQLTIEILAPGLYRLDGAAIDDDTLDRRLRELADGERNAITNTSRPRLTILGDAPLVNDLAQRCMAMGMNNIQTVR